MKTLYLQGKGTHQDAIFIVSADSSTVKVVAEVGLTGCIDDPAMPIERAREVWTTLKTRYKFTQVAKGRRTAHEISRSIND